MATLSPAGASGLQVRPAAPRPVRRRGLPRPGTVGKFAVLTVAVFLTLGPVVWTVWTSFRPQVAGAGVQPGFSAYVDVFAKADVLLLVWNSVLVTSLCALGQMVTAAMAGYVFARVQFRGSGALCSPSSSRR